MTYRVYCFVLSISFFMAVLCDVARAAEEGTTGTISGEGTPGLLSDSCFDCHRGDEAKGNLDLQQLLASPRSAETDRAWWNVLKNVRAGTMPPPDSGYSVSNDDRQRLYEWLKYSALGIDREHADPGRVTVRRLNRREYANTIRDLMGLDFNADVVFPPDDTGFGFDNVGDALSLSPLLIEKYLNAATDIVTQSVPTICKVIPEQRFRANDFQGEGGKHSDNMRAEQPHQVIRRVRVDQDGQYELSIDIKSQGSFDFSPQRCKVTFTVDGQALHSGEYGWDESKHDRHTFMVDWTAGEYELKFALEPLPLPEDAKVGPNLHTEIDIEEVTVQGPTDPSKWHHPRGYERFFDRDEPPVDAAERRQYARQVLQRFTTRAFRRPADELTLTKLVDLAESIYSGPDKTFESGVAGAMIPVLASPRFLFRIETPANGVVEDPFPLLDDFALASRLSYFLWSTMPDEPLFELAAAGQLHENLETQLDRMLADKRSGALIENFVGQWLRTRDVETVSIDPLVVLGLKEEYESVRGELFSRFGRRRGRPREGEPVDEERTKLRERFSELAAKRDVWDGDVRTAMRRETEMLLESIFRENRSVLEIINPNYTFLNEKLAKLYGIPDVSGPEMRKVMLPADSPRGGILAQGTMLTVTSNPTRTSPVKRGLYILENVLGTPSPPAPPNVPTLEDTAGKFGDRQPTLREVLELHRESALCASCHARMDPLGLALENFNALGMWRDEDNGQRIESAGKLITGEEFQSVRELKQIIANERRADFYRCLTQKLLIYALGRGLESFDEHAVDQLVEQLDRDEGRMQNLVKAIVHSTPFQRQRQPILQPALAGAQP